MACQNQKDNFDTYSDALSKRAVAAQKSIDSGYKMQWDDQEGTYVPYVDPDCSELDVVIEEAMRSMSESMAKSVRELMVKVIKENEAARELRVREAVTQAIDGMKGHAIYTGYYDVIREAVIAGILASQGTTDGA